MIKKMPLKSIKTIAIASSLSLGMGNIPVSADFMSALQPSPYSEPGRAMQDLQSYAAPVKMMDIIPNRPITAHEKDGTLVFYSPDGKLIVQVGTDGAMSFTVNGLTKTKDAQGNLTSTTEVQQGTNKEVVKNAAGEVLGYKQLAMGGQVVSEYDYDGNLTKSYQYDKYGKNVTLVVDELTQTKTIFNADGLAEYDIDAEGNKVATYAYDAKHRLSSKTDVYGNITHYDTKQNATFTEDSTGNVVTRYNYRTVDADGTTIARYDSKGEVIERFNDKDDSDAAYMLDSVEAVDTGEVTYFDNNGKQTVTKNAAGSIVKDYEWDHVAQKLLFTFDRESQETTWYDILGRATSTTVNAVKINEWLYNKGRMVGYWNSYTGTTTIFKNQREELTINSGSEPPSADQIQKWVDDGLIESTK